MKRICKYLPALVCAVLLLGLAGCSGRRQERDYLPAEAKGRTALEAALTAWQNDQPVGRVDTGPVPIQVVDSHWQKGQKLESYEILKAEGGDGPVWFSVELQMKNPPAKEAVRYVVIGRDPLWVYREEDYRHVEGF